jgi:hypothetical protein
VISLVGLTGYAQHGKDSVGQILAEEFGFTCLSFAAVLKSMALTLDPLIPQSESRTLRLHEIVDAAGWEEAKRNPEVRRFLQVLGTEAVRGHIDDDAWVNALARQYDRLQPKHAAITDCRFPNEADWVRSRGGELWRIVRLNPDGSLYDNGIGTRHSSERHVAALRVDRELHASDLSGLRDEVRRAVNG